MGRAGDDNRERARRGVETRAAVVAGAIIIAGAATAAASCGFGEIDVEIPDAGVAGAAGDAGQIFDAGGEVPAPPNGEDLCPPGVCNFQTQEGCPYPQACWPYVDDAGEVFADCADAGSGQSGATCSGWLDCARSHACVEGRCRRLCCGGDWSACADSESCIRRLYLLVGDAAVSSGVHVCFPVGDCDVLDENACAAQPGFTCQLVDPRGAVACMPEGSSQVGEVCSPANVCAAGLTCVGGECRRLCRTIAGAEPSCPAGEGVCVHYSRDPEGVGECTVIGD